MKKAIPVLLLLCAALTACAQKQTSSPISPGNVSVSWDCQRYSSLEAMNEAAQTRITPAGTEGVSDEWYGVISKKIAQYTFKLNGEEWCIRASRTLDADISGLYYDDIRFEKLAEASYYNDAVYVLRFFQDSVQYVISLDVSGRNVSHSHFDEVAKALMQAIEGR